MGTDPSAAIREATGEAVTVSPFVICTERGKATVKALGIIRRADDLGRVVLPLEWRQAIGVEKGTSFEMFACSEGIFLRLVGEGEGDEEQASRAPAARIDAVSLD